MAYSRDSGEFNAAERLKDFWAAQMQAVQQFNQNNFRDSHLHALPLARIKKIMKLDESVKTQMISAEVPVMLAKACEIFIEELTLRAWIHTEENKRKTLQKNDIAMAVSSDEQYDFLIDIVPREFSKQRKQDITTSVTRTSEPSAESIPYVIQLSSLGSGQGALNLSQTSGVNVVPQNVAVQGGTDGGLTQQPQPILQLITAPNGELQLIQPIVGGTVPSGTQEQQTSLLHQIITSDGSTAYLPVQITNSDSMQLVKAQMGSLFGQWMMATSGKESKESFSASDISQNVRQLMSRREQLLKDYHNNMEILKLMNVRFGESMTDAEGYPRSDIDVRAARVAMSNISKLKYDLKLLDKAMEEGLVEYFSAQREGSLKNGASAGSNTDGDHGNGEAMEFQNSLSMMQKESIETEAEASPTNENKRKDT